MASIERTAYPQFRRTVSARELRETFTPTQDEIVWARDRSRSEHHLLALLVWLKVYGRLGYFPDLFDVPLPIVDHIRGVLELKPDVDPMHDSTRTTERHRDWVRERLGVLYDPSAARDLAEAAVWEAVRVKDNPANLINVVLEELVRARLELPGYTTLDEMVARIRAEVNQGIFAGIAARMVGPGAAAVGHLREHVRRLAELEAIGPTEDWLAGVLPAKVAHFAGEARETDAADLSKYGTAKRQALIASLVLVAKISTRDEITTMLCKRMAIIHKRARERLELLREQYRGESERLLDAFGDVLAVVRDALGVSVEQEVTGESMVADSVATRAGRLVLDSLARSGGVTALSAAHEEVSAHHGNNYLPFVEKFYRSSRSALFQILDVLSFEPASSDHAVFDALGFLRANRNRSGEYLNVKIGEKDGRPVELDLSFASENWRKILYDARRPGKVVRRHFEACVFSYLAAELRSGDMAVAGSESYANFTRQLLSEDERALLWDAYCAQAGLPADAAGAVALLRERLESTATAVDEGYPANADLVIAGGRPTLKRRKGKDRRQSALELEAMLLDRLPERGVLEILTRTAYQTGWTRHFGPPSGSDTKIKNALGRYVLVTFTYGANLGPAQVARHMPGQVSVHELHTAATHADAQKIHKASVDVVNAFARLDISRLWGDGSRAGTDGTQIDTWSDNLLC